ncbi:solute symporter family protein [Burkholderia multivorans]|uniref:solute symporter family protein n=1 Tax=Burkholderia multivorans TaxID=87883 RepID=UPI001C23BCF9|nr:cation acetate symporter [Burkholderia multivorans]MBU9477060.1 cation acetate symporter [Burkholderia multivorans]
MLKQSTSYLITAGLLLLFLGSTFFITWWANRRSRSATGFFVAGRSLKGWQNGLAICGDYMSAASFLGIAGLVSLYGFDGLVYSFGFIVGWSVIVLVVAEPLRNAGKYTLTDVMAYRLEARPVRAAAAASSLSIGMLYMLAQLVGAGVITSLLLPIPPTAAIVCVGVLMITYVMLGGMVSTTYVQIFKAVLVFGASTVLVLILMSNFGFSVSNLMSAAADASGKGSAFLEPGLYFKDKLDLISLGLALALGTAGLPHIMMRFYTVPRAKDARVSSNWVIGVVGVYLILTTVLGFGAAALVGKKTIVAANAAGNGAAPLLALHLGGGAGTFGGQLLLSFISAVTFMTILAVVSGLMIAAASNVSHDLYAHVVKKGKCSEAEEVHVARWATLTVGVIAVALAIAVRDLNVAFLVGVAFAVAASANLPVILYSLYWKRFNTVGAMASLTVGLVSAIGLVIVGPAVIGSKGMFLKDLHPLIPFTNPGIVSIPIGFFAGWLGTILSKPSTTSETKFEELKLRALTGIGAEKASNAH